VAAMQAGKEEAGGSVSQTRESIGCPEARETASQCGATSAGAEMPAFGSRKLRRLTRQADALERELLELVRAHRPRLIAETGCGALTAAVLIGRTAGAERLERRRFRPPGRRSADPMLLRPARSAPARPRRRPPAQPRAAHHRDHAAPLRPRHEGLPRAQASRGQDQEGGSPLPQPAPRPALLPAALPARPRSTAATRQYRYDHRRRRPDAHALRYLAVGGRAAHKGRVRHAAHRRMLTIDAVTARSGRRRLHSARHRQNDAF
jgi:hypothetical protein